MKKILILLCLGLAGCTATLKQSQPIASSTKKSEAATSKASAEKLKAASSEEIEPATACPQVPIAPEELDSIISVFSEAIKIDPLYAGAYYNRAIAYFYKNELDKSWKDVHKAESLGYKFNASFLESLRNASEKK